MSVWNEDFGMAREKSSALLGNSLPVITYDWTPRRADQRRSHTLVVQLTKTSSGVESESIWYARLGKENDTINGGIDVIEGFFESLI